MQKLFFFILYFVFIAHTSIQSKEKLSNSDLYQAVQALNSKKVSELIEKGVNINQLNEFDKTALHAAVEHNSLKLVKQLIAAGATLEAKSYYYYKWTPLHWAVYEHNFEIVKYLVDVGANINAETYLYYTPLDLAFYYNAPNTIIHYLFEHGGRLHNYQDEIPKQALDRGNINLLQLLLDHGCNIDAQTYDHQATALHIAVQNNQYQLVKFLLNAGANADIPDEFGQIPAYYAKHKKIKKLFEDYK